MTEKENLELLRKTFEIPHELLDAIAEWNKVKRECRQAEKEYFLEMGKALFKTFAQEHRMAYRALKSGG